MMVEDDKQFAALCEYIEQCIKEIGSFTRGLSLEQFIENRLIYLATLRSLETMADAVKRLRPEFEDEYPEILWSEISGFRNILAHDYLGDIIDNDLVWEIIQEHLSPLGKSISRLHNNLIKK